jgi:hypothetical protein
MIYRRNTKPINLFGHEFVPTRNDCVCGSLENLVKNLTILAKKYLVVPPMVLLRPIFKEAGFNLDAEAPDQIQGMIGHGIDFAVPGAWTKKAKLANMAIEGATGLGSGLLQIWRC